MKIWSILVCVCCLWSCKKAAYRYTEGGIYGTFYHVVYESDRNLDTLILEQMERVNASLSMFNSASVLAKINRGESDQVDSLFVYLWEMAKKVNRETNGAFDLTVAPLVNIWGFGYKHDEFPSAEKIDSLLKYVGMDKVSLEGRTLVKMFRETELDASSIAKGLGVDLAADCLESKNVKNYMVEIGGEIRVKGHNAKGQVWRIGIDRPLDSPDLTEREIELVIGLKEGALATSGNYRNYYTKNGRKYAHTISPKTGYPVQQDVVGATIYAPTCMEADAYATACMVMGLKESKKVIGQNPELEACLIYKEGDGLKVWMTDRLSNWVVKE